MENLDDLQERIIRWAGERNLLDSNNARVQSLKVAEECGELCGAVAKNDTEEIFDALGDVFVTIVILADQCGLSFNGAVEYAVETIEQRTGNTVNGVFIKHE